MSPYSWLVWLLVDCTWIGVPAWFTVQRIFQSCSRYVLIFSSQFTSYHVMWYSIVQNSFSRVHWGTTHAAQLVIFCLNYTGSLFRPEYPLRQLVSPTKYFPLVSLLMPAFLHHYTPFRMLHSVNQHLLSSKNLFCVFSIKDSKLSALQSVAHLHIIFFVV